jgi:hypothetical protein
MFLRRPARFLHQDQDPAGIEELERRLVQEIDAMLRASHVSYGLIKILLKSRVYMT